MEFEASDLYLEVVPVDSLEGCFYKEACVFDGGVGWVVNDFHRFWFDGRRVVRQRVSQYFWLNAAF